MALHALLNIEQCTLGELINLGADYLDRADLVFGHGTDNPTDEAAWLVLEACGLSPVEPVNDFDVVVNQGHLARAKNWFRRRAEQHEPVAYITGRAWFAGLEFATDARALIPRSPIAELITKLISRGCRRYPTPYLTCAAVVAVSPLPAR
ncbi:MAG: hypothetical protein AAF404_11450 [Pseudomonadota bacterium]